MGVVVHANARRKEAESRPQANVDEDAADLRMVDEGFPPPQIDQVNRQNRSDHPEECSRRPGRHRIVADHARRARTEPAQKIATQKPPRADGPLDGDAPAHAGIHVPEQVEPANVKEHRREEPPVLAAPDPFPGDGPTLKKRGTRADSHVPDPHHDRRRGHDVGEPRAMLAIQDRARPAFRASLDFAFDLLAARMKERGQLERPLEIRDRLEVPLGFLLGQSPAEEAVGVDRVRGAGADEIQPRRDAIGGGTRLRPKIVGHGRVGIEPDGVVEVGNRPLPIAVEEPFAAPLHVKRRARAAALDRQAEVLDRAPMVLEARLCLGPREKDPRQRHPQLNRPIQVLHGAREVAQRHPREPAVLATAHLVSRSGRRATQVLLRPFGVAERRLPEAPPVGRGGVLGIDLERGCRLRDRRAEPFGF